MREHFEDCPQFENPGRRCDCAEIRDMLEDIAADMAYDQRREDAL